MLINKNKEFVIQSSPNTTINLMYSIYQLTPLTSFKQDLEMMATFEINKKYIFRLLGVYSEINSTLKLKATYQEFNTLFSKIIDKRQFKSLNETEAMKDFDSYIRHMVKLTINEMLETLPI